MSESKLTPDLVVMAIETGMLDDSLPALRSVIDERLVIVQRRRAASLAKGDRFYIKDCSPKKWNDVEATFDRVDGQWLVCTIHDYDAARLKASKTVRLRESHVGHISHKVGA